MKQPNVLALLLAFTIAFVSAAGNPAEAQTTGRIAPVRRAPVRTAPTPVPTAGPEQAQAVIVAPTLQSAAVRKSHGGVNYDLGVPLAGATGIEPRNLAAGVTLVLNFDQGVTSGSAAVTAGTATAGAPSFSGTQMFVPLANVANAQAVTVTVSNVVASGGGSLPSRAVTFRTLEGDVNGSGSVSVADVNLAKYYVGAAVTPFNARADVNVSNSVSVSDINLAKFRVGTSVPGGAQANTPPAVSTIANQSTTTGAALAVNFTATDGESSADTLGFRATSNNQTLLPDGNIALGGSGANRTLTLTPAANQNGTATITLVASDGLLTSTATFALTVSASTGGGGTSKLFVTSLRPEAGAVSSGSGNSVLQLSPDETFATVRVQYSNLTTTKTSMHVHGPADPGQTGSILFDLDTTPTQPDGSWRWVFVPTGGTSVADQVAALKAGRLYVNVHSSKYPSGELRGHYLAATGSQTFTPPPPPPAAAPTAPAGDADAVRFLAQATYGPTDDLITQVRQQGYDAWINNQFNIGQTKQLDILVHRRGVEGSLNFNHYWDSWWKLANTAPDQLRQRVAFALSQHFVVSYIQSILGQFPAEMGNYYDTLARGATGNFRQLMEDVTLSPIMGEYLNLRGSAKPNPNRGNGPNENYARELLQLFCIGLHELHPDGTLKLDENGQVIETYGQDEIMAISRALTGWNYHQSGTSDIPPPQMMDPMTAVASEHDTGEKRILRGVVIPAGGTVQSDTKIVLDTVFNHPNVGPFVAKALIQKLVCSNPSPGYVYRVAQKFNNNGSGVRGDMKAVVKAILTDYEARHNDMVAQQGFGKLREPLLRTTYLQRALHGYSVNGHWSIDLTDEEIGQTPMAAPTVFNFFEPGYTHPGVIAQNGLVAPEFQITNETTAMKVANWTYWGVFYGWKWGDIKQNLQTEANLASNPTALVDRLNTILCAGQLSPAARTIIINHVSALPANDPMTRAKTAAYLVGISSQFVVQR